MARVRVHRNGLNLYPMEPTTNKTNTWKPDGLSQHNADRNQALWNQHKVKAVIEIEIEKDSE